MSGKAVMLDEAIVKARLKRGDAQEGETRQMEIGRQGALGTMRLKDGQNRFIDNGRGV